jgi:oligoribonuclease NrnB/cAMP/cGMP phosphodiesterase (DHH superfamily)
MAGSGNKGNNSKNMNSNQKKNANLMKALSERAEHVVHLTHNDLDAAGCDAIHRRRYAEEGVFTIWCSVGRFPSMLDAVAGAPGRGDLLSISDLGCQEGMVQKLKKARSNGWRIEWRDHHRWRDQELAAVEKSVEVLHLDTGTCATGIVARDLQPDDHVAREIASVVCDYDLWRHEDPRSKVLGQVVMQKGWRDYVRDRLAEGLFADMRISAEYDRIVREMNRNIDRSQRHAKIIQNKYRIVFAPLYGYPSETAHALRDRLGSEIEVIVSPGGKFSIRSVPEISHLIAREFDGGGHPHAAGGKFEFSLLDKFSFMLLRRTRHYRELAGVAATL